MYKLITKVMNKKRVKKVKNVEEIIIDPNAKGGQTFQLDNGVTMAFVGKNDYYLIYKVIIRAHSKYGIHSTVDEFVDADIRESKRKAEACYDKLVKAINAEGLFIPKYPYDYDPEKGLGISIELAVSEMDHTFEFNVDHIYKTTYSINENLRKQWEDKARGAINAFEKAQDNDKKIKK